MSSGSRRNSSNPKVPSGRAKISTQRSTVGVEGLLSTLQDGSSRTDMALSLGAWLVFGANNFPCGSPAAIVLVLHATTVIHRPENRSGTRGRAVWSQVRSPAAVVLARPSVPVSIAPIGQTGRGVV